MQEVSSLTDRILNEVEVKPDTIQDTWLKPSIDLVINGYGGIRKDGQGGIEYILIEIWGQEGKCKVIHFYNPCKTLTCELVDEVLGYLEGKIICCGDFYVNSTIWGESNDKKMGR